jgi:hypothetical protein
MAGIRAAAAAAEGAGDVQASGQAGGDERAVDPTLSSTSDDEQSEMLFESAELCQLWQVVKQEGMLNRVTCSSADLVVV